MSSDALADTRARATSAEWVAPSNDVVTVELVRSPRFDAAAAGPGDLDAPVSAFHPQFTYPFYGDNEEVVGFRNPRVTLRYSAASLAVHVSSSYDERNEAEATLENLVKPMLQYLPPSEDLITDPSKFAAQLVLDAQPSFTPPGTKVHQYSLSDRADVFEVYLATFSTPGFTQLYRRFAILPMFFIEGATPVDETDSHWDFALVYRRRAPTVSGSVAGGGGGGGGTSEDYVAAELVAVASLYSFFMFPASVRRRLSQLVVLPPYRRAGHARILYEYLLDCAMRADDVAQLTIEDPSEAMDAVRDVGDLHYLTATSNVTARSLAPVPVEDENNDNGMSVDTVGHKNDDDPAGIAALCTTALKRAKVATLVREYKLHPRQAERVYEMLVLRETRGRAPKPFRLMVKARILRANQDALEQLESHGEQVKKIHEAYVDVLDEYRQRLRSLAAVEGRDR